MYPRHDANHLTCTHFGAWNHTCMLTEIKGITSGHLVYNHKAYNHEQGCWEIRRTQGKIISWTPMMSFSNNKNWKQAKALRIPLSKGPYALQLPDIDCVLLNFLAICLFLKFGPPSWFRAQGTLPPSLSGPDYRCLYVVTFFLVNFVFFKAVNWQLVYAVILTLVFYFRWISKMHANYCLEILKRQMQEIKERNGCFNLTFYILHRIISKKITNM